MAPMSAVRIVQILILLALFVAALGHALSGKQNQTFDGIVVQNFISYEFYPDAKDCNYWGTPYILLPNHRLDGIGSQGTDSLEHLDRALHSVWRAKLNGNLSRVQWFNYSKRYWRELSVNYVVDATLLSCGEPQRAP